MRFSILFFLALGIVFAQEPAPVGIVKGKLSLLMIRGPVGTMDINTAGGDLYQCDFDAQSLFERSGARILPAQVDKDEAAELVTDRKRGRCYARIVRMTQATAPSRRASKPLNRGFHTPFDISFPRGNLTFAGLVIRTSPGLLILRTRAEPEARILLREDTRFLKSGSPSEFSQLDVNARVFVRGGRNLHNELEAFQIVWGEIEGPKHSPSF